MDTSMAHEPHITQQTNYECDRPRSFPSIIPRLHVSRRSILTTLDGIKCEKRLHYFVETFVTEVETYLEAKYLLLQGQVRTGESRDVADMSLSEIVGRGVGGLMGWLFGAPGPVSSLGGVVGQKVNEAIQKKKLYNLAPLIYDVKEEKLHEDVRKVLIECGFHIFKSYEEQVMGVTSAGIWHFAVNKLVRDAVHRAISYCAKNRIEEVTVDDMTKGVVDGTSKKQYFVKRGLAITYKEKRVTTEDLYTNPGLAAINSDGVVEHYFKKLDKKCNTSKYGHRLPFNWEYSGSGNIDTVLGNSYQREEKSQFKYKYEIKPNKATVLLGSLYSDIWSKEQKLTEKRRKEIVAIAANDMMNCDVSKTTLESLAKKLDDLEKKFDSYLIANNLKSSLEPKPNPDQESGSRQSRAPMKNAITFGLSKPDKNFTGREEALHKLEELLSDNDDSNMVIVCGERDVGKSELARKYASKHAFEYKNRVWINADSFESMQSSFIRLASQLEVKTDELNNGGLTYLLEAVYQKLIHDSSLFIFDNAEQFDSESEKDAGLDNFLPKGAAKKLHIIITSRHDDWDSSIPSIQLDPLPAVDTSEFMEVC